jgi:acyl CoA:acetate/3-ketoacid CoA transferase alpha subunit
MDGISRRNVLKQLALGGLIFVLPAALLTAPATEVFRPLASRLKRFFRSAQSAQIVGQRYLAVTAGEADAALLAARIAGTQQYYLRLVSADEPTLRALLAVQQQADFAEGRTVNIDGWILSRTEARLCALAALDATREMG